MPGALYRGVLVKVYCGGALSSSPLLLTQDFATRDCSLSPTDASSSVRPFIAPFLRLFLTHESPEDAFIPRAEENKVIRAGPVTGASSHVLAPSVRSTAAHLAHSSRSSLPWSSFSKAPSLGRAQERHHVLVPRQHQDVQAAGILPSEPGQRDLTICTPFSPLEMPSC